MNIKVPEQLKEVQGMEISDDEIETAMRQMPNGKTCGNDKIPVDFYKEFWGNLENIFMSLVREIRVDEILHRSAKLGVINMIPKQDKDMRFLKNQSCYLLATTKYLKSLLLIKLNHA